MHSTTLEINHLLESLDEEDYGRAISYIKFLIDSKKKEKIINEKEFDKTDIDDIISSLTGIIPDTGKTLAEYRNERLKKYENIS